MNAAESLLSAPRLTRVLFAVGALVLAAGIAVFTFKMVDRSGSSQSAPLPALDPGALSQEGTDPATKTGFFPTVELPKFKQLNLAPRAIIKKFILTAVAGKNLDQSWPIVSRTFKDGYTLKTWMKGELPIVPFAVDPDLSKSRFGVLYSKPSEISVQAELKPAKGTDLRAQVFEIVLKKNKAGATPAWLVDYWGPRGAPPIRAVPDM